MLDPLDVISSLENVFPTLQPIYSADAQTIVGYEVFNCFKQDETKYALDAFFLDDTIPTEYRFDASMEIGKKALHVMEVHNFSGFFVFKNTIDVLLHDDYEAFTQLVDDSSFIQFDQIIIEIQEPDLQSNFEKVEHLLNYLKTYGYRLSISQVGIRGGQLDRLTQIQPNTMKLDLPLLRQQLSTEALRDMLYTITLHARKIGAALAFEKIEQEHQLQEAWRYGGRYYQGSLLGDKLNSIVTEDLTKLFLQEALGRFTIQERKRLETVQDWSDKFSDKLRNIVSKPVNLEALDNEIFQLAQHFTKEAFRFYACNEVGFQLSSNIEKEEGVWILKEEYKSRNWSWRPYFLTQILRMNREKTGMVSDFYSDIETGEWIRTFAFPLGQSTFLFIDLTYEYLYEHDYLLLSSFA
ncbi:EAL-associated domain-containing protein [Mangrovibacillus cuniculi]|uniref:EAL domain-containing protein n=1 Tax=Mangrovibacillus cuniculi TaxID=2593652 RepID=A0A7S8HES5_9BACI|nr:EAL-associated domain-containing protein [Mangrovibacillus cuniculi]QPC46174.1 EAL domain-containing protein [Mangrovibacillus cuniculi]